MNQYKGTKLLEMLFVAKLAEQVDADEVIVNLANPGFTAGTAFCAAARDVVVMLVGRCLQGNGRSLAATFRACKYPSGLPSISTTKALRS